MKELIVLGRGDAETLAPPPDWVAISIHDPSQLPAALQPGWAAVLRLAFHDKEDKELAARTGLWQLFDAEMALRCWQFVDEHRHRAGLLIHCSAGASRSPALARAIAADLSLAPDTGWPSGNPLVLRRMRETRPAPRND